MRISLCVGNYAKIPYCVPGPELSVYCIEELCFCMKENAFLLDTSLMSDALIDWIDGECGLNMLAVELHKLLHKMGSFSAFVTMILEYTGLYDEEIIRATTQVLKQSAGLSGIEKRKSQIDYMVKKKRYSAAIHGYDELLKRWDVSLQEGKEVPAARVRGEILHNKGVAFTGLMLYKQAAECFAQSYEITRSKVEQTAWLAAKRMELTQEEYIAFAAEKPEFYEVTLQLEKTMEALEEEFKEQPEYLRMLEHEDRRTGREAQKYYEENEHITHVLKGSYRRSVSE